MHVISIAQTWKSPPMIPSKLLGLLLSFHGKVRASNHLFARHDTILSLNNSIVLGKSKSIKLGVSQESQSCKSARRYIYLLYTFFFRWNTHLLCFQLYFTCMRQLIANVWRYNLPVLLFLLHWFPFFVVLTLLLLPLLRLVLLLLPLPSMLATILLLLTLSMLLL